MSKGERTREHILRTAAGVFNQRGYAGASVADLVEATGLERGGIYRHFESKETLALEAFDHAVAELGRRQLELIEAESHAADKLHAYVRYFLRMSEDPPFPGGCPVMNTAIENDSGNPALRERAQRAMGWMRSLLRRTIEAGQSQGQIRPDLDPQQLATVMIATLEGALMLTLLYEDEGPLRLAAEHLDQHIEERVRTH